MNEPKVHMLKSGMIADKVIIILLLTAIIILSLYISFFMNKKVECIETRYITTEGNVYTTKKNK